MTCSGTKAALEAGQEAPRCLRCDKLMPEYAKGDPLDCGCAYGIKPSPLSSCELVVVTDDPKAEKLLRSLGARYASAIGWFLKPARVRLFEALWKAEAVLVRTGHYRFPDGTVRHFYSTVQYLNNLKRKKKA